MIRQYFDQGIKAGFDPNIGITNNSLAYVHIVHRIISLADLSTSWHSSKDLVLPF